MGGAAALEHKEASCAPSETERFWARAHSLHVLEDRHRFGGVCSPACRGRVIHVVRRGCCRKSRIGDAASRIGEELSVQGTREIGDWIGLCAQPRARKVAWSLQRSARTGRVARGTQARCQPASCIRCLFTWSFFLVFFSWFHCHILHPWMLYCLGPTCLGPTARNSQSPSLFFC